MIDDPASLVMSLPNLSPVRLSRRPKAFDSDDYLFELKIDGYRSLAYLEAGECRLVSRHGNVFHGFRDLAQWIGENLRVEERGAGWRSRMR